MLVMMNLAFSTALSALLAVPVSQEPAQESAIFDLSALSVGTDRPPLLSVMDLFRWDHPIAPEVAFEALNAGRLVDLFEQVLNLGGSGAMRYVGGSDGSESLSIVASAEDLELARQLYGFLESSMNGSRKFEVLSFDASQVSPAINSSGSVLSPEDADKRIQAVRSSGVDLERWAFSARPGRTMLVSNEDTIPFLGDYDAEIAQGAFLYTPVTFYPRLGPLLCARATPAGDAARLSLFLQNTEAVGPVETRMVTFGGMTVSEQAQASLMHSTMPLERLEVQSHGFGIQVALRSGEAVELSIDQSAGGSDPASYLIRCLDAGSGAVHRAKFGDRELFLIDPGASHRGSIQLDTEYRLFPANALEFDSESYAKFSVEEWGPVIDRLRQEGSSGASSPLGPFVSYVTKNGNRVSAGIEAYFKQLESPDLAHRVLTTTVEAGGESVARFRLPCLEGSRGFAFSVRGSLRIAGADSEVAQFASVIEPEVAPVMEGAVFSWHARAGGEVSLEAAVRSGEPSVISLGEIGKGILDRMPLRSLYDRRGLVDGVAELGSQGGSGLEAHIQLQ